MTNRGAKVEITEEYIFSLYRSMQENLKEKRFIHTVGVAGLASSIAMSYGYDSKKALIAGLLHDVAKEYSDQELIEQCTNVGIPVSKYEKSHGFLLHGKYGSYLAKTKYGVDDEEILNAIYYHTSGKENMSFLEKVIFCADFLEVMRTHECYGTLNGLREMVFKDIDKTVYYIYKSTVEYILKKYGNIDKSTMLAYSFYETQANIEKKDNE